MIRLLCWFRGHDYEFVHNKNTYMQELGIEIPYKIQRVYICKKCLASKFVRI